MAALLVLARAWCGVHFAAHAVGFRHRAPPRVREHARVFGRHPEFGARENFVVFPSSILALPLCRADGSLARYFEARLDEQARAAVAAPGPLADVVTATRKALPDGTPTVASIGRRLGLSGRTLQRRLRERGVTFGGVLDSVRREIAMAAIGRPNASVQEIASMCGFADPKALRRAFVSWTGQSPREYRRTHS